MNRPPLNLYNGEWQLLPTSDPYQRKWIRAEGDHFVVKTETLAHSIQAEQNAVDLDASAGKRWGDGQVAARIPLDLWFKHVLPRKQAGDDKGLRKWLNDPEQRQFRTFHGNV